MCHGYEWEMLKAMRAEQMARRDHEKAEAKKRQEANAAPPKAAEPAPRSKDREPVPA